MASLELAIKYCFENSLNIIGVRPFTVYGPLSRPDSDVFKAATSIRSKSPVELYKTSSEEAFSRDFVFVDDVVRGIIAAIRYPYVSCDKVFNLGSGSLVSMERIVHLLETELNAKADIVRPWLFLVFLNFKCLFFQCRNTYQFQCTRWISSQLIW